MKTHYYVYHVHHNCSYCPSNMNYYLKYNGSSNRMEPHKNKNVYTASHFFVVDDQCFVTEGQTPTANEISEILRLSQLNQQNDKEEIYISQTTKSMWSFTFAVGESFLLNKYLAISPLNNVGLFLAELIFNNYITVPGFIDLVGKEAINFIAGVFHEAAIAETTDQSVY